jgi:hypothetical protein
MSERKYSAIAGRRTLASIDFAALHESGSGTKRT